MKIVDWAYRVCCWILGVVFIYAGTTKLFSPRVFAVLIEAYGIVPDVLLMPVAVFLPALEVAAGIGILFDVKGSLAAISGLVVMFLLILGYGIHMGLDVDCGCFGPEDPEALAFHGLRSAFNRDLGLMAGVVFAYAWRRYRGIAPKSLTRYLKISKIIKKENLA
ncbi:MauE/DoxX family redox-associated membrane protein [Desulfospira joergensenii]|uniref:MauE/DoxX family redox-associated membrane protein n=1 Tax=Desulfospira joergensenii TaxID=53329 RepID=UPI0003B570DE|nr:MauE/DoxX family redox-associated membrane protein [Desulfospira joergensenii]